MRINATIIAPFIIFLLLPAFSAFEFNSAIYKVHQVIEDTQKGQDEATIKNFEQIHQRVLMADGILLISTVCMLIYIFQKVLSPLSKMQRAIRKISKGNTGNLGSIGDISEFQDILDQVSDLAEKRQAAEHQQALTADRLTQSNEDLSAFIYVAYHDLKTPLRGIDTLVTWIAADAKGLLSPDTERHLELLRGRILRMEQLLEDLVQYTKLDCRAAPEMVDPLVIIQQVWQLIVPPERLHLAVTGKLPMVFTSRIQFEIPFRHLLINAVKHHDTKQGTIRVSGRDVDPFYEFTIEDDGPGIHPDYQKKIFKIFQTLHPKDKNLGSGIGLSMVKKVITQQGGTIKLVSNPDQQRGCTFIFTWPKTPDL